MMRRFLESFSYKTSDVVVPAINTFAKANLAADREIAALRAELESISAQLNIEYDTNQLIQKELLEANNKPSYNAQISAVSNEISKLREKQAVNQNKIKSQQKNLGITEKQAEISSLQEDCLAYRDAIIIATIALLENHSNISEDVKKWATLLQNWVRGTYENQINDQNILILKNEIESINLQVSELNSAIEEKPHLESKHSNKLEEISELEKRIHEINSLRTKRALATGLGLILQMIINLYFLIFGDPLSKVQKKRDALTEDKKKLEDTLNILENKSKELDEYRIKLLPLNHQYDLVKTYIQINQLQLEISNLEEDDTLKLLVSEEESLSAEENRLEQTSAKLQIESDKLESSILCINSKLTNSNSKIRVLEDRKENLSRQLMVVINTKRELTSLEHTQSEAAKILDSSNQTINETDTESLDSSVSSKSKDSYRSTKETDAHRASFFRSVNDNEDTYKSLLSRKVKDYSKPNGKLNPMSNLELHAEQLNKGIIASGNARKSIRSLIKNLQCHAEDARATSSEKAKYSVEISLLESLNQSLNLYCIYASVPNIQSAQEKYENILRIIDEIRPKLSDSFSFKQQAQKVGINLETIEKIVNIQQKVLISEVLEKCLQRILMQKKLASKAVQRDYKELEKAIQKYQSILLDYNHDDSNKQDIYRVAPDALSIIDAKKARLQIDFGPAFESAINAGNRIIGIDDNQQNILQPR